MFKPGTRIYNTLINRSGVTVSQEYQPDNAGFGMLVDVRWDKPYGNRTTVSVRHLIAEATLR